jgi:ribose transport system substrate-binding protein
MTHEERSVMGRKTTGGRILALGAVGALAAGAIAAGTAGAAASKPVQLPKKTVGFLQITSQSEVARRIEAGAKAGAKALGWKYVSCDAKGVPAKFASCGDNLVRQKVDVILSDGVEPAPIKAQLQKAKAAKIPWIGVGGRVTPDPLFAAQYAPDDAAMAKVLDAYMISHLGSGNKTLAVQAFDAITALKVRRDQLLKDIAGKPITVVATNQTDFTDPFGSVTTATNTVLNANSDLNAIWAATDFDIPAIASVIGQKFPGKNYPARPMVVGFYGDLANLDALRKKQADAIVEVPLEATGYVAIDQYAQLVSGKRKKLDPQAYNRGYGLGIQKPFLITQANVPANPKQYVRPKKNFEKYFLNKWKKEFSKAS